MPRRLLLLVLPLATALGAAPPRRLAVAAAADLQVALAEARTAFARSHPDVEVGLTFGASGTLHAQLLNRAPFDLFLSADLGYPQRLVEAGAADGSTLWTYGRGHLVVWVPKDSPIPVETLGLAAVLHPAARRVALANPRHAPYGRAAEAALAQAGLLEQVRPRLVFGENVSQTAQFVQSGAADVGLIALSLAQAPALAAAGRWWALPAGAHPPLDQGGVVLTHARDRAAALAFRDFLRSPEGLALLRRHGFVAGP